MPLSNNEQTVTYLILGDGDFTFSLDLATFLAKKNSPSFRLIATGFDSLEQLESKYKDSAFILKQLKKLGDRLAIEIHHGVNAIALPEQESLTTCTSFQADVVIFNHPHLGTENAKRHSRFLKHLFRSVQTKWLSSNRKSRYFYLTLAKGQYERWQCEEAAHNIDSEFPTEHWTLLNRLEFYPPPVEKPYYQHRRHQTGKSFASRIVNECGNGASETFVYALSQSAQTDMARPIWYEEAVQLQQKRDNSSVFTCLECNKHFPQERSLKSHIQSKHSHKRQKRDVDKSLVDCCCEVCSKTFDSLQALQDHVLAKHAAIHSDISPDWAIEEAGVTATTIEPHPDNDPIESMAKCSICQHVLPPGMSERDHIITEFQPESGTVPCDKELQHSCSFCSKQFREKRARLQHENFCTLRTTKQDNYNHVNI